MNTLTSIKRIGIALILALLSSTLLFGQRNRELPTDAQIQQRLPQGVTFIPNIAYREGNDAWKLDLAMPDSNDGPPRPAIVFIHGGGWRNGDKRANAFLKPTIDYAANGYVCITVNYRMLGETNIVSCVEDVKNAVRWLRAHAEKYNVDPDRIGATGNSAGAHLSVMLGLAPNSKDLEGDGPYQDQSSAVQAVAASATPASFLFPMSDRGKANLDRIKAGEPIPDRMKNSPFFESEAIRTLVSPITHASADAPPMLLYHEQSDATVDVKHSDRLVAALRTAGAKDVSYMLFGDGSGHGVFQRNIATTEPLREAFFQRTLGAE